MTYQSHNTLECSNVYASEQGTVLVEVFCQCDLHFLELPRNFEKVIAFYSLEWNMLVALKVNKFVLN